MRHSSLPSSLPRKRSNYRYKVKVQPSDLESNTSASTHEDSEHFRRTVQQGPSESWQLRSPRSNVQKPWYIFDPHGLFRLFWDAYSK